VRCPVAPCDGAADGADRAEEFADPEGSTVPLPPADGLVTDGLADAGRALAESAAPDAAGLELTALDLAAVAEGEWLGLPVPVSGLNVATDNMAPATRQTARMLASSGITVPCPANGPVSLRSRRRRRSARNSRWYAITSRSSSRASSGIWMSSGGSSQPDPPPGFTRHLRPSRPLPSSMDP
jgi:hypothetical protein